MQRELTQEWMDAPDADRGELETSLRFIRRVNRWLGGDAALVGTLRGWSRRWPRDRAVRVLDVGTGLGDLPVALRKWGLRAGFDVRIVAVDLHPTTLDIARGFVASQSAEVAEGIELVEGDALAVVERFGRGSFDYAHAGMFLHHLSELRVMTALTQMDAVARRGIVWNDLWRTRVALVGIRLLTTRANAMVRHDAVASVKAGFTRREALDLCARSDARYVRWRAGVLTQRFVVAGEKPGAWDG